MDYVVVWHVESCFLRLRVIVVCLCFFSFFLSMMHYMRSFVGFLYYWLGFVASCELATTKYTRQKGKCEEYKRVWQTLWACAIKQSI